MSVRRALVTAVALLVGMGCAGGSNSVADTAPTAPTETVRPTAAPDTAATETTIAGAGSIPGPTAAPITIPNEDGAVVSPSRSAELLCARDAVEIAGRVEAAALDEASGLVASRVHAGVLWSHNDGGEQPGVFAIAADGADLGFHALPVEAVDLEDMAIAAGADGDELYLADIGDNRVARTTISLFRFPEPDPSSPGPVGAVERFDFTYPDGPHNAEAFIVDEATGRIVVITKEQEPGSSGEPNALGATLPSFVFEGRLGTAGGPPVELVQAGFVDTQRLEDLTDNSVVHPSTVVGLGGVVTGADLSAEGALVALRTYEAVWVWPREDGQSVAEVFEAVPCQVATFPEAQGEAVAFADDGLITLGEGVNQRLYRLGR